ncbi:MAG: hypothetical protein PHY44_01700 [Lachnospiraceae bacterium]|nr:hypothetical protein [Lachnospiraceae bacterium]
MKKMEKEIKKFCDANGYDFYANYSGRGMFGNKCVGIVGDNTLRIMIELFCFLLDIYDGTTGYELSKMLGSPMTDNMGEEYILYFPKIEAIKE